MTLFIALILIHVHDLGVSMTLTAIFLWFLHCLAHGSGD